MALSGALIVLNRTPCLENRKSSLITLNVLPLMAKDSYKSAKMRKL